MAHLHIIQDKNGDSVDQIVFCSDFCNRDFCSKTYHSPKYQGEFGCQEISFNEPCANCNNLVQGILDSDDQEQTLEEFEQTKRVWECENDVTQRIWP